MIKRILMIAVILMFISLPVQAGAKTIITKEDVYGTIRANFMAHKEQFRVDMSAKTLKEIGTDTDLLKAAVAIDDNNTSEDGDYLDVSVISWNATWEYNNLGKASITITAKYRTTPEQEKQLDDKMASVIKSLNLKSATDYEKVIAIHDYIIQRVTYDQSLQQYTAYNALIEKSAVCEGYAALAYRMFTDVGIDSKIISGQAGGGEHVWNIVKVDGKWYNIDLTWDDPTMASGEQIISYDYFLKNAEAFSDHVREPEYNTKKFLDTYKMAANSYQLNK